MYACLISDDQLFVYREVCMQHILWEANACVDFFG